MRPSTSLASNASADTSSKKATRRSGRNPDTSKDASPAPKRRNKQKIGPPINKPVDIYKADEDRFRKESHDDNYAGIQTFFASKSIQNDEATQEKVREAEKLVKEHYSLIRPEFDEMVKTETVELLDQWREAEEKPNVWKKSLVEKTRFLKLECPTVMERKWRGYETKNVGYLKQADDECGNSLEKFTYHVKKLDTGDFNPPMTHWVSIHKSINTDDMLKLTHMPYFTNVKDDQEMYHKLSALFPDGIHGFACNWSYINDWLAYKVCRSVLEKYRGEPDILYYALYRVWPNKFSQREFSQMFPKLCRLYAEDGFDAAALEPWKEVAGLEEYARNVQTYDCYACLSHICPHHGFSKQTSSEHPKGDFATVRLPLPSDKDTQPCGGECWKTIPADEIRRILKPDDEERAAGKVKVILEKAKFNTMAVEKGSMIVELYTKQYTSETFCEFAKNNIYPESPDSIKTCRDAYLLIANLAENIQPRRIAMAEPARKKPTKERVQCFRNYLARPEPRKSQQELEKLAQSTGRCMKDVEEEEDRRLASSAKMEPNKQFIACRHLGPCGPKNLECSCGENRICSELCQCDINCKQRFPGCNCSPGQCQTKRCQCWYANWECSPSTCKECRCDSPEAENACKNFPMTKMVPKRMLVAPSKIAGNGLFLLEAAEKDDLISEYVGERISDDEAERRGAIYDRYHCSYIFNLNTGGAIDSYKIGNLSRFANHDAKNPSMVARTKVVAGEHRIGFYAKRKLAVADELTFDYGYFGEHRIALKHVTSPVKKARKESPSRSDAPGI